MLDEMRRAALLILMDTLYDVDFAPHDRATLAAHPEAHPLHLSGAVDGLGRTFPVHNSTLQSAEMDSYLYQIIAARREDT